MRNNAKQNYISIIKYTFFLPAGSTCSKGLIALGLSVLLLSSSDPVLKFASNPIDYVKS